MEVLLGSLGDDAQVEMARHITTLPLRIGGLGLRSHSMAPAAFWASWADALPMLQQRLPELTRQVLHVLEGPTFGCLGELQEAIERLDRFGFVDRPNWEALRRGLRPRPPAAAVEPGEWQHGW